MKETTLEILEKLIDSYPQLRMCREEIEKAFLLLKNCCEKNGRIFVCGNGGSASDSEHIVGELLKSFKKPRPIGGDIYKKLKKFGDDGEYLCQMLEGALPAFSLTSQMSIITAFSNDKCWEATFAQELYGLGQTGDCLISLSTSGNSKNCVYAVLVARAKDIISISLTGEDGGKLKQYSDCTITAPEKETYKVQELHLPIYHCLCAMLENEFF